MHSLVAKSCKEEKRTLRECINTKAEARIVVAAAKNFPPRSERGKVRRLRLHERFRRPALSHEVFKVPEQSPNIVYTLGHSTFSLARINTTHHREKRE